MRPIKDHSLSVVALATFIAGVLWAAPASADAAGQTLTFSEYATVAGYTAIGVTFDGGPCCIQPGNSNGDPGGWDLEGTNDPYFLGFNDPYESTVGLDETVTGLSLDAARSSGSSDGTITLEALLGTTVVDTDTVILGAINEWSTLSVSGPMDGFRVAGTGSGFHPFGIDNVVIGVTNQAPTADAGPDQTVTLDGGSVAVTLDGSGSSDPDDDAVTFTWTGDFVGGSTTGSAPEVVFDSTGTFTVTLEVSDGQQSDTDTVEITVDAPQAPTTTTSPDSDVDAATEAPAAQPTTATPTFTG
jgi:hypothetical protein